MERKTLKDYLGKGFKDKDGNPIWFASEKFNGIYSVESLGNNQLFMRFRSYHPYLGGISGGSDLSLHLEDIEATPEDHKRKEEKTKEYWKNLPFDKQKEHIQFAYDMGADIPKEDIKKYKIKTQ